MFKLLKKAVMILTILGLVGASGFKGVEAYSEYVEEESTKLMINELKSIEMDGESLRKREEGRNEFVKTLNEKRKNDMAKMKKEVHDAYYKEKKRAEEARKKHKIKAKSQQTYTMTLTFYTDLNCENGFGPITASGKRLTSGHIANNVLPIGTKVYIDGYGMKTVEDRGGNHFNSASNVDVFVPRQAGESDSAYYRRVNNMGRRKATATIYRQ